jgi:RNA polymerase sigma factor (sigma-70 family)
MADFEKLLSIAISILSEQDEGDEPERAPEVAAPEQAVPVLDAPGVPPAEADDEEGKYGYPPGVDPAEFRARQWTPEELKEVGITPEISAEWRAMPHTLENLTKIKLPLIHGWTEREVVKALEPYIYKLAQKYVTERFPIDDAAQEGAIGVLAALKTDGGLAPIATHAWKHIQTAIRRASAQSGLIRKGERGMPLPSGGYSGPEFHDVGVVPIDAPSEKTGRSLADTIAAKGPELSDLFADRETLDKIIEASEITPQQMAVMSLVFGLDGKGERDGQQIALELGISKQRVNQLKVKGIQRLKDTAQAMGIMAPTPVAPAPVAPTGPTELEVPEVMPAAIEPEEKMESFYKLFRNMLVEMIVKGEMNGVILG